MVQEPTAAGWSLTQGLTASGRRLKFGARGDAASRVSTLIVIDFPGT